MAYKQRLSLPMGPHIQWQFLTITPHKRSQQSLTEASHTSGQGLILLVFICTYFTELELLCSRVIYYTCLFNFSQTSASITPIVDGKSAFVGFTSGKGGNFESHHLLSWTFTNTQVCFDMAMYLFSVRVMVQFYE